MGDWLSGFGSDLGGAPRPPRPRPPPVAGPPADPRPATGTWRKGQRRLTKVIVVPCCEECGSDDVRIRTPRGENQVLMECCTCRHRWKDMRDSMPPNPRARPRK